MFLLAFATADYHHYAPDYSSAFRSTDFAPTGQTADALGAQCAAVIDPAVAMETAWAPHTVVALVVAIVLILCPQAFGPAVAGATPDRSTLSDLNG